MKKFKDVEIDDKLYQIIRPAILRTIIVTELKLQMNKKYCMINGKLFDKNLSYQDGVATTQEGVAKDLKRQMQEFSNKIY